MDKQPQQPQRASINEEQIHNFFKGWRKDFENHLEMPQSYDDGINGRLYSKDGRLSYSSIEGTRLVYENANIKSYNGFYAFKDELVVFGKCDMDMTSIPTTTITITEIVVSNFSVSAPSGIFTITGIDFSSNFDSTEIEIEVQDTIVDEDDFNQDSSCNDQEVIFDESQDNLFKTFPFLPVKVCPISDSGIPINNTQYKDYILSFTYNDQKQLVAKFHFIGYLNLPADAKICTEGVDENIYYKRVYFTDFYNYSRIVNLKDRNLATRNINEFSLQTTGKLMNPRIKEIKKNGQIKAMTVFYMMRLVTENGQVSDYSALSAPARIVKETDDVKWAGGTISEQTPNSVVVGCYVPDFMNFKEIELIAIEFEAPNVPTNIKLVGRKAVAFYVEFEHFGSEPVFQENITIADIFANSISWRYNSDFSTKNNKLLASGLRNDPSYVNSRNIALDFGLHGFSDDGSTHDCLLNPDPVEYPFINALHTESFFFVKRRLYRSIEVFGNFKIKLVNDLTGEFYEYDQPFNTNNYANYTQRILDWLLVIQQESDFSTKFPNLEIKSSNGRILFDPINGSLETDFQDYNFSFTTAQVVIDMDNKTQLKTYSWPATLQEKNEALVYGGVSNGWYRGNGIRVTMHTDKQHVLDKNTDWMNGSVAPLRLKAPTLKKYAMKGEIYRIGVQWYKNGQRLFTTVLGDLKIPDIGMVRRELDEAGNVIQNNGTYSNHSVDGERMLSEGIELQFDIRISCEFSKEVDAWQPVFVERTEQNRTILAQGITGPLEMVRDFSVPTVPNQVIVIDERTSWKWQLPNNGGPVYDSLGLVNHDISMSIAGYVDGTIEYLNGDTNPFAGRVFTSRDKIYFDAPDLYYDKISDQFIQSSNIEYLETIRADHDKFNVMGAYNGVTAGFQGTQVYFPDGSHTQNGSITCPFGAPKFSQKIPLNLMKSIIGYPNFVNVSVFSERIRQSQYTAFQKRKSLSDISQVLFNETMEQGELASGYKFEEKLDFSNNAMVLAAMGWFYQISARRVYAERYTLFHVNNVAGGRKTSFIKTKGDYFTNEKISQAPFPIFSQVNFGTTNGRYDAIAGNDAYFISNLKRKDIGSIYGGNNEYAYAANEYIPMGNIIPIIENRVTSQVIYAGADTYCTLVIRNKATFMNSNAPDTREFQWSNAATGSNLKTEFAKWGAWCYAVVLETTVEPRFTHAEEFYRLTHGFDFFYEQKYNQAYLQENNLRKSIPKPYNFKDDPNLTNIVAASKVKLSGDFIDAWTQFETNEFYELDKNKGAALNIVKQDDEIFVVQELQTSNLFVDQKNFITPDEGGEAIQVHQGDGKSISGHKILSDFGTSIRRAVIDSPFGFVFFDERKSEIVKINKPLFMENDLLLAIKELFNVNKVLDCEGYYDDQNKETNIRFRTTTGLNFVISYNEIEKAFNGKIQYDNDLYMTFQEKVLAPYADSSKVDELNTGRMLEFFGEKKFMTVSVISSPRMAQSKINKRLGILTNIKYPIIRATFETSLGHIRQVLGTHHWYKIYEGLHNIPAKNQSDVDDIRGEWTKITVEVESKNNQKIDLLGLINYFRISNR